MKTVVLSLILIIVLSIQLKAQVDSTNNLLDEITQKDTVALLPDKYVFTQHILWGKKGLMRKFDRFELTPEKRQEELKVRRTMLKVHQALGYVTMAEMIAQGIIGVRLYNGKKDLLDLHGMVAGAINITYFSGAALALFAPPKMLNERKGYGSIKLHKALAIIHLSSMIATNILASQLESHENLRPYHRAAAFTAFGSFALSMAVIKF